MGSPYPTVQHEIEKAWRGRWEIQIHPSLDNTRLQCFLIG
jgi:hypothetical protein